MSNLIAKDKVLNSQIVAYFDFDGTITRGDTLLPFLLYTVGLFKFIKNLHILVIIVLAYLCKIITNETAKQKALIVLLKGFAKNKLEIKAQEFARFKLDHYIKPKIYYQLEHHLEQGHSVIIVSANLAIYLNYWVKIHKLTAVVATEIEFNNDVCTGKLATRNCYGIEKSSRIKTYLHDKQNHEYRYTYAYGNSKGDYAMLDLADEAYWINGSKIVSWSEYRA